MGDRTWWYEPCPKCGHEIEVYDAPSSLMWSYHCNSCGYDDDRDYYEIGEHTIALLTPEQYKERTS